MLWTYGGSGHVSVAGEVLTNSKYLQNSLHCATRFPALVMFQRKTAFTFRTMSGVDATCCFSSSKTDEDFRPASPSVSA